MERARADRDAISSSISDFTSDISPYKDKSACSQRQEFGALTSAPGSCPPGLAWPGTTFALCLGAAPLGEEGLGKKSKVVTQEAPWEGRNPGRLRRGRVCSSISRSARELKSHGLEDIERAAQQMRLCPEAALR
ncbi:hypothetical protein Y1Q_0013757 [Alligator mississippiensis]|uniref:Uncharacterized protein n=1 Tax=Alligator mississippiensis TaxID=8496 RepID=A0A151MMG9_ALLMI|nr:hypothetical protein Y1Q_0013757 [Alligator mississippiensis]